MKFRFTKHQWERISEILSNLGLLMAASLIIPFTFENLNITKVIWGVVISTIFWYISIIFAKKY